MSKEAESGELVRALNWQGAFWVAAGVPPLVLFSIGGIAGTTGKLAFVVWMISIMMGFMQSFTYAEIAGMFGNKSGGASVYGATAWVRYSKFIAPLSVWCNWFAWSPVLSLGCAIAAGYILNALFSLVLEVEGADAAAVLIKGELARNPTLLGLDRLLEAQIRSAPPDRRHDLELVRGLVSQHIKRLGMYKCDHCGFRAKQYYWRCPGCLKWETYSPRRTETPDGYA